MLNLWTRLICLTVAVAGIILAFHQVSDPAHMGNPTPLFVVSMVMLSAHLIVPLINASVAGSKPVSGRRRRTGRRVV